MRKLVLIAFSLLCVTVTNAQMFIPALGEKFNEYKENFSDKVEVKSLGEWENSKLEIYYIEGKKTGRIKQMFLVTKEDIIVTHIMFVGINGLNLYRTMLEEMGFVRDELDLTTYYNKALNIYCTFRETVNEEVADKEMSMWFYIPNSDGRIPKE